MGRGVLAGAESVGAFQMRLCPEFGGKFDANLIKNIFFLITIGEIFSCRLFSNLSNYNPS